MKKNLKNLSNIDKAMDGASMKTTANIEKKKNVEKKLFQKMIKFPNEWNDLLKEHLSSEVSHITNVNQYINNAIYEQMKKDGIL